MAFQDYVNRASAGGDGSTNGTAGASAAYASLSSWEANTQTQHSGGGADDYIVDCDAGGGSVDSTSVVIDFATNISTGSITIRGNSGVSTGRSFGTQNFNSTCYTLQVNGTCFQIVEKFITLQGLQIDCTSTSAFVSAIRLDSGTQDGLTVDSCRIRSTARSCMGYNNSGGSFGTNPATFKNNIAILAGAGSPFAVIDLDTGTHVNFTWNVYHNTFYSINNKPCIFNTASPGAAAAQALNIKNNICANTTTPFSVAASTGVYVLTTADNYTDSGANGTTNEHALPGGQFTSPGTGNANDFSLTTALATAGSVGSITTDLNGNTRGSPPDAGAHEYTPGGGGDQSLVATGFADSDAFGTPSVAPGAVNLTPTGVPNTSLFGAHTVTPGAISISPSGFADPDLFGAPTVVNGLALFPSGFTIGQVFGTPTVGRGAVNLAPTGFLNPKVFGFPTLSIISNQTLAATGFINTSLFGAPEIRNRFFYEDVAPVVASPYADIAPVVGSSYSDIAP